jgi:DNA repair and recombination protein RAD52
MESNSYGNASYQAPTNLNRAQAPTKSFTLAEEQKIGETLKKQLGPEFILSRVGTGQRFLYLTGKTAISLANEIFGFNGWSFEVLDVTTDYV